MYRVDQLVEPQLGNGGELRGPRLLSTVDESGPEEVREGEEEDRG